jgi:hypothetical protein
MGKTQKLPIAFIVVCNVIIFIFLILPVSGSEICKQQYYAGHKDCAPYEVLVYYLFGLTHFIKTNEGAFTALSTIVIAVFTWRLYVSTDKLWEEAKASRAIAIASADAAMLAAEETRKSVDLASKEFVSSHRPKVIMRRASLYIDPDDEIVADATLKSGVAYVVANVGDTDATVVESNATIHVLKVRDKSEMGDIVFSAGLPVSDDIRSIGDPILTPGVAYTFLAGTPDDNLISAKFGARAGYAKILFVGYVIYADANGVRRRTQFCRQYEPITERFIVADTEHDYTD